MASDSADQALSRDVISFVIWEKIWLLGYPIHSTGIGAIEQKLKGPIIWRCFRHRQSRRSLYGP
jgi:hypothetical protein